MPSSRLLWVIISEPGPMSRCSLIIGSSTSGLGAIRCSRSARRLPEFLSQREGTGERLALVRDLFDHRAMPVHIRPFWAP